MTAPAAPGAAAAAPLPYATLLGFARYVGRTGPAKAALVGGLRRERARRSGFNPHGQLVKALKAEGYRVIVVDLPVAGGGKQIQANAPPLTLSVKRTGGACNSNVELYLGDTLISANDLLPKIKAIRETRSDAESVVYLRGDKDVCYTDMMKLLGYIRTAGFKANIVIVPEQGS